MGDDAPPERFTQQDAWDGWVMRRLADGWCSALDRSTMLCSIYAQRPDVCRQFDVASDDCMTERKQLSEI